MTLAELRKKRDEQFAAVDALRKKFDGEHEDGNWTPEQDEQFRRACDDYDATHAEIEAAEEREKTIRERRERFEEIEERRRSQAPRFERIERDADPERSAEQRNRDMRLAFQGWALRGRGGDFEETDAHREAYRRTGINPNGAEIRINGWDSAELRAAQSALTGTGGGYTVAEGFVNMLEVGLLDYSSVRQVASIMRTDTGAPMPMPGLDDTSNSGSNINENQTATETAVAFNAGVLNAYKISSDYVTIPTELLEDSAFNVDQVVADALAVRLARRQNNKLTVGTGANEPTGVVVGSTAGKTTASSTAIAFDEIIDLKHSVDPAYRRKPSVRFMFHDNIFAAVRKLKDGNSNYIWNSYTNGAAATLDGDPYVINQDMASTITSGDKTILYGAFEHYKVREVRGIRVLRDMTITADQLVVVAYMRFDGLCFDGLSTFGAIKHMVQT